MHAVARPLIAHPDFPPSGVTGIFAHLARLPDGKGMLRFRVEGIDELVVPEFKGRGPGDELWRTTCFELFLKGAGEGYREFNFSPSGQWAAYLFAAHRSGMAAYEPFERPDIASARGTGIFAFTAMFDAREFDGFSLAGLSAVIEEQGGRLSYWALAHPAGRPDFHDPACFAAPLVPPEAA